jgi:hypothetical protein
MGKYADIQKDVFSIFKTARWTAKGINTFPSNFVGEAADDYIRIHIISGGKGVNINSVSGILNIDIFVAAGKGPNKVTQIADTLDTFLVGEHLSTGSGVTQIGASNLVLSGADRDNPSLYRAIYSVPFNYFTSGV